MEPHQDEDYINGNGSVFFGEFRDGTSEEIRTYVSQHIADELMEVEIGQEEI